MKTHPWETNLSLSSWMVAFRYYGWSSTDSRGRKPYHLVCPDLSKSGDMPVCLPLAAMGGGGGRCVSDSTPHWTFCYSLLSLFICINLQRKSEGNGEGSLRRRRRLLLLDEDTIECLLLILICTPGTHLHSIIIWPTMR